LAVLKSQHSLLVPAQYHLVHHHQSLLNILWLLVVVAVDPGAVVEELVVIEPAQKVLYN